MINKIKEKGIDLSILIKDELKNLYVAEPFKHHADYKSFQLKFNFEDWTNIVDDGKEHLNIVAVYANANDEILVKFQEEDFDTLLDDVKKWNDEHRFIDVRDISELPNEYRNQLYIRRFIDDINIPIDEYINRYEFITIDGVVYCSDSEHVQRLVKEYISRLRHNSKTIIAKYLPYAIIEDGCIIKNRYGSISSNI